MKCFPNFIELFRAEKFNKNESSCSHWQSSKVDNFNADSQASKPYYRYAYSSIFHLYSLRSREAFIMKKCLRWKLIDLVTTCFSSNLLSRSSLPSDASKRCSRETFYSSRIPRGNVVGGKGGCKTEVSNSWTISKIHFTMLFYTSYPPPPNSHPIIFSSVYSQSVIYDLLFSLWIEHVQWSSSSKIHPNGHF